MDFADAASTLGTVASTAVAIFAWKASRNSADAAAALNRIERTRLHAELRPQFRIYASRPSKGSPALYIKIIDPPPLYRLDEVRLTIRQHREFVDQEGKVEIADDAPVRFLLHEGDDESPWTRAPFPLIAGDGRGFPLEVIKSRRKYDHVRKTSFMLMVECRYADYDPWLVPLIVAAPKNGWWQAENENGHSSPSARQSDQLGATP